MMKEQRCPLVAAAWPCTPSEINGCSVSLPTCVSPHRWTTQSPQPSLGALGGFQAEMMWRCFGQRCRCFTGCDTPTSGLAPPPTLLLVLMLRLAFESKKGSGCLSLLFSSQAVLLTSTDRHAHRLLLMLGDSPSFCPGEVQRRVQAGAGSAARTAVSTNVRDAARAAVSQAHLAASSHFFLSPSHPVTRPSFNYRMSQNRLAPPAEICL